ncbi:MAG: ATP cone domain-containing protein [Phycisphaerae bacterium]
MSEAQRVVVTKRDGTKECLSVSKLQSCLRRVLRIAGNETHLAEPLARALASHVRHSGEPERLTTNYVYRCVNTALVQTGLVDAAEVLARHRRQREARRRRLRVFDPAEPDRKPVRWRKGALVDTLRGRYGLRQPVARYLAAKIEDRVFGLDYRSVSRTLLAELMRNEVLAWGLPDAVGAGPWGDEACEGPLLSGPLEEEK